MDSWTDINSIMRDLSVAQGRAVPVDVGATVAAGEKPPALDLKEETEEEYYGQYTGDTELNKGPDLSLIQQMLYKLYEEELVEQEANENKNYVNITKSPVNTPGNQRRNRNAAMASIKQLQTKALAKDEFEPSMMFKRKSPAKLTKENTNRTNQPSSHCKQTQSFKPSNAASEYYQKFVERKKLQDTLNEDVWSRAERQMREIEEKRQKEREQMSSSSTIESTSTDPELGFLDSPRVAAVRLAKHRHLVSEECLVCKAIAPSLRS